MEKTIASIPPVPGVYIFLDPTGEILYIGKAKNLRRRVASYFQRRAHEPKIEKLVREHESVRFIATKNEIAALLLEAYLIRTYQPPFNALLRDGNPFLYLVFTEPSGDQLPRLEIVRQKPKRGRVFGPFIHKKELRTIHEFLERTFSLKLCTKKMEHGCLDFHIGRCAGACRTDFDRAAYTARLELAHDLLSGNRAQFLKHVQAQIEAANRQLAFEKARELHTLAGNLEHLFETLNTKFSEKHYQRELADLIIEPDAKELDRRAALEELGSMLGLPHPPRTIDCFDISHFQGRNMVGSCVRFTAGQPDPDNFRRFLIRSLAQQNDYAALHEIVSRRYRDRAELPDVILIDGGKGQLHAVRDIVGDTPCLALAKREETLFSDQFPEGIRLDLKTAVGRLLIALRNYAHHFAISFFKAKSRKEMGGR
ncbi:MAG: GIY-YIG nuclease family protein [Candidatus Dependentiae bacterium]|nr:GIY-YIG nuclease family protein [Candidatus Dependentiae bacterium]